MLENDDLDSISERLLEQGLISDVGVFEWYVERNGGLEITPGYFEIRPDDHMGNVLGRLRTPPGQTYTKVTFPEGFTVAKMAERLDSTVDRLTAADFLAAAQRPGDPLDVAARGRHVARRAAVPRHVPGVERRERRSGHRADDRA